MIPGMILQVVPVLLVISMELCGWKSHVKMYWRRAEGSTAVSGIWIENRGAATFPELVHRIFLEENPKLVNSRVSCKECPIPNPLKNVNTNGSRPFDPCPGVSENGYNKIYEHIWTTKSCREDDSKNIKKKNGVLGSPKTSGSRCTAYCRLLKVANQHLGLRWRGGKMDENGPFSMGFP